MTSLPVTNGTKMQRILSKILLEQTGSFNKGQVNYSPSDSVRNCHCLQTLIYKILNSRHHL